MISYNVLPFYQKKDKKLKKVLVRAKHFFAPRLPDDSSTNRVNSACLRKPAVLDPAALQNFEMVKCCRICPSKFEGRGS